jgi:hypothetical protein
MRVWGGEKNKKYFAFGVPCNKFVLSLPLI